MAINKKERTKICVVCPVKCEKYLRRGEPSFYTRKKIPHELYGVTRELPPYCAHYDHIEAAKKSIPSYQKPPENQDPLDRISGPEHLDRISGPSPLSRISTSQDTLDRWIASGGPRQYRRRRRRR